MGMSGAVVDRKRGLSRAALTPSTAMTFCLGKWDADGVNAHAFSFRKTVV
jgi:hypothetical protein